jgi:hypothetical protein
LTDRSEEFFEQLSKTPQPQLGDVAATIRVDVDFDGGGRTWLLRVNHGQVDVSRRTARADAVIKTDRLLFERMVTGEANSLTAILRGRMQAEGDLRLLLAFDRLMPSPPGRRTTIPPSGPRARESARTVRTHGTATRSTKVSAAAARATRKDRAR